MDPLVISGKNLRVDDVAAAAGGCPVRLDPAALPAIERSRAAVERLVAEGRIAYGITTGFGRFKDRIISPDQTKQLQLNLVRSHAVGVGPPLDERAVRAMLLVRANTLAMGYSGVRPLVVQSLIDLLNAGVHPRAGAGIAGRERRFGPLAHVAQVLIGEGQATYGGELLDGRTALARAGLKPIVLEAKEGLALLNGTSFMVGLGRCWCAAVNLAMTADIAAKLSLKRFAAPTAL